GVDTWVVWSDPRNGQTDIYGARVSDTGTVEDMMAVPLSTQPQEELTPRVASNGAGPTLVTYSRFDPDPTRQAGRVWARTLRSGSGATDGGSSFGAPCSTGSDCASGQCVDAVCCNGPCGASNAGDCQACSIAAGAAADGICGPVQPGHVCRPS